MIEDVIAFYKHWNSFSTLKSFGYKDKYKASTEDEWWIKRAIEKENQKERKAEKKLFNDTVK